jgi:putative SOS response-associated peptidase YedK
MCGRFYLDVQADQLAGYFELVAVPELSPRFNIAPSQTIAAVVAGETGRELRLFRWGLIPFWAKDEKFAYRTINARAETAHSKPAFRAAFKARRCLIPATGFFEWQAGKDGKHPYCIRPRQAPLFAFAGLYEHWKGDTGKPIDSCTILVTAANDAIQAVHDRMPVILPPEDFALWLDREMQDPVQLQSLLRPRPDDEIVLYPVSKRVNKPSNDDPACIEPLR